MGEFERTITELALLAEKEDWRLPSLSKGEYPILFNYVHHTFSKLVEERKVIIVEANGKEVAAFNTGLATRSQEEIFGFFERNRHPAASPPYFFKGWRRSSEPDMFPFNPLPEIAHYFSNPADLIFDTRRELRIDYQHIVTDNRLRFPGALQNESDTQLVNRLRVTVQDAIRRVQRNYKTAIPQYYKGKLQLLLPLCLENPARADLALVIERDGELYRAATCLTLDMAVNNARLIAKPDREWLKV